MIVRIRSRMGFLRTLPSLRQVRSGSRIAPEPIESGQVVWSFRSLLYTSHGQRFAVLIACLVPPMSAGVESLTPNLRRNVIIGHQSVKAD